MKTKIRNSINGLLLIPLVLICFALLPSVQATPDPGVVGGGNSNAADGFGALNATVSGINNSGFGANALHSLTAGNNNAAQGNSALFSNTGGNKNTAVGVLALRFNGAGSDNTAVGYRALNNATTSNNTAVGSQAGVNLTEGGSNNTFLGALAGFGVTTASGNICIGTTGANENSRTFVANLEATQNLTVDVRVVTVRVSDGRLGSTDLAYVSSQKVEEQQASIAQLQKRIEVLTAQLNEQASQIQKVSAQLEVNKPAPRTVANK